MYDIYSTVYDTILIAFPTVASHEVIFPLIYAYRPKLSSKGRTNNINFLLQLVKLDQKIEKW